MRVLTVCSNNKNKMKSDYTVSFFCLFVLFFLISADRKQVEIEKKIIPVSKPNVTAQSNCLCVSSTFCCCLYDEVKSKICTKYTHTSQAKPTSMPIGNIAHIDSVTALSQILRKILEDALFFSHIDCMIYQDPLAICRWRSNLKWTNG